MFLSLFSPYAQQWSGAEDWKKRHAVLSVIGQMADPNSSAISEAATPLLDVCVKGLKDQHVRVRWAACQAIGLLANEMKGSLSKPQREQLIIQLMQAPIINDPSAAAVQAEALGSVCSIVSTSARPLKEQLLAATVKYDYFVDLHLTSVFRWILTSMDSGHAFVHKAALDCLSEIGRAHV